MSSERASAEQALLLGARIASCSATACRPAGRPPSELSESESAVFLEGPAASAAPFAGTILGGDEALVHPFL